MAEKTATIQVITGQYEKDGQKKYRYETIATKWVKQDGSVRWAVNPLINLAAVQRPEGQDVVWGFERDETQNRQPQPQPQPQPQAQQYRQNTQQGAQANPRAWDPDNDVMPPF